MATLEIRDLHVSVDTESGTKEILRGVDLTVRAGETHAVMGPNDARLRDRRPPEVHRDPGLAHPRR